MIKMPWKKDKNVVNLSRDKMIVNAVSNRLRNLFSDFNTSMDGKRNLNEVYGYEENLQFDDYFAMYKRSGIANRMLISVPRSCWRDGATVTINDEGAKNKPVLEEELATLKDRGLFIKLERADILNRIGSFSVLFIGIPDGLTADQPIGTGSPEQLDDVYFMPFGESSVTISKWVIDPTEPRFGLPLQYTLTPRTQDFGEKETTTIQSITAHWSRVVHMAEGALTSDIYGQPYLEPIFNRVQDWNKTVGGGAEAYFRNAVGKFALEVDKEAQGILTPEAKTALKEEVEAFTNNMQNYMRLAGMKAKPLSSPHQDPKGTADTILMELTAYSGIPKRILTGEGGGQLAGNEDKESYNAIVGDRQNQVCELWFMDALGILDEAGMIELPDDFSIDWPVVETLNEKDKSEIMKNMADAIEALGKAISMDGGFEGEITAEQIITEVLGLEYKPEAGDDVGTVE